MVKVVHVITSSGAGGAEGALFNLLAHTPGAKDSAQVICLTGNGVNAGRIRELSLSRERAVARVDFPLER